MAQVVSYFTGLETGDGSEVSLGTSITVQTTNVRTGGYSLKAALSTGFVWTSNLAAGAATQMVYRTYILLAGAPGTQFHIFQDQHTGGTNRLMVDVTTAKKLQVLDGGVTLGLSTTTGTTVLNDNQYYRIEVIYDLAAGGVVQVLIDGVSEISVTHTNSVSASPLVVIRAAGDSTNACYYDDTRIDTGGLTPIGAGQIIARQGTNNAATVPTYNAWTKAGLTTAGANWSETPFGATNKCTSSTNAQAQTMVVDKFSVDPSRAVEGTQVIGASDTINAVRVLAIAKAATTSTSAWSLRRRVGGADTDTVISPSTTADSLFATAIFTDTAANLDAYQIGAVITSASGILRTVEDMWMMVDYSPVTNTADTLNLSQLILTSNALTEAIALSDTLGLAQLILTSNALTEAIALSDTLGLAQLILTSYALTETGLSISDTLDLAQLVLTSNAVTEAIALGDALDLAQLILTSNAVTEAITLSDTLRLAQVILTSYALTDVAAVNETDTLNLAQLILTSKAVTEAITMPEALAAAGLILRAYGVGDKIILPKAPLVNHKARNAAATLGERRATSALLSQPRRAALVLGQRRTTSPSLSQPHSVSLRKTRNNDPELDK